MCEINGRNRLTWFIVGREMRNDRYYIKITALSLFFLAMDEVVDLIHPVRYFLSSIQQRGASLEERCH